MSFSSLVSELARGSESAPSQPPAPVLPPSLPTCQSIFWKKLESLEAISNDVISTWNRTPPPPPRALLLLPAALAPWPLRRFLLPAACSSSSVSDPPLSSSSSSSSSPSSSSSSDTSMASLAAAPLRGRLGCLSEAWPVTLAFLRGLMAAWAAPSLAS